MRITFKLFASLGDYLPPQVRPGNVMTLDVAPTDSIATIIAPFHLPPHLVHIVLVNGTLIARGEVVVVNEKFGIRLTDVISPSERIKKLR